MDAAILKAKDENDLYMLECLRLMLVARIMEIDSNPSESTFLNSGAIKMPIGSELK